MLSSLLQLQSTERMAADATKFISGFLVMPNKGPRHEFVSEGFLKHCFHEDQALTNILDEAMRNLMAKEYQTAVE